MNHAERTAVERLFKEYVQFRREHLDHQIAAHAANHPAEWPEHLTLAFEADVERHRCALFAASHFNAFEITRRTCERRLQELSPAPCCSRGHCANGLSLAPDGFCNCEITT